MTSSTERCRKHRARRRAELMQFAVELPMTALATTLIAAEWLNAEDVDNPERVHAALQLALEEWCGAGE
jgi:hypothetical protein